MLSAPGNHIFKNIMICFDHGFICIHLQQISSLTFHFYVGQRYFALGFLTRKQSWMELKLYIQERIFSKRNDVDDNNPFRVLGRTAFPVSIMVKLSPLPVQIGFDRKTTFSNFVCLILNFLTLEVQNVCVYAPEFVGKKPKNNCTDA